MYTYLKGNFFERMRIFLFDNYSIDQILSLKIYLKNF